MRTIRTYLIIGISVLAVSYAFYLSSATPNHRIFLDDVMSRRSKKTPASTTSTTTRNGSRRMDQRHLCLKKWPALLKLPPDNCRKYAGGTID